ncbi:MAG: TerB N-terminal domain-containing protein [Desulfomonilaceae bacterium]
MAEDQKRKWDTAWQQKIDRQRKITSVNDKKELAAIQTKEIEQSLIQLMSLLSEALNTTPCVDWEELKDRTPFPNPKPTIETCMSIPLEPAPTDIRYKPKITWLDKIFRSLRSKKEKAAEERFRSEFEKWLVEKNQIEKMNNAAEADYQTLLSQWQIEHEKWKSDQSIQHEEVEAIRRDYLRLKSGAVISYCESLLTRSQYPEWFSKDFDLDYYPVSKTIVVDYSFPAVKSFPAVSAIRYDAASDEFRSIPMKERIINKYYDSLTYQITLRTIHELFEADIANAINTVVFNDWVPKSSAVFCRSDLACIISIQCQKQEFFKLNLRSLSLRGMEPKAIFKKLIRREMAKPHGMVEVVPAITINHESQRNQTIIDEVFAESTEFAEKLEIKLEPVESDSSGRSEHTEIVQVANHADVSEGIHKSDNIMTEAESVDPSNQDCSVEISLLPVEEIECVNLEITRTNLSDESLALSIPQSLSQRNQTITDEVFAESTEFAEKLEIKLEPVESDSSGRSEHTEIVHVASHADVSEGIHKSDNIMTEAESVDPSNQDCSVEISLLPVEESESFPIPNREGPIANPFGLQPFTIEQPGAGKDEESQLREYWQSVCNATPGGSWDDRCFFRRAKLLESYKVTNAKFVNFQAYYSTYDSMDINQKLWYFYWRDQVRNGIYPDTETSYIFVHVYELINNVGVLDPISGHSQLYSLWLAYRPKHPALDRYLPRWIADYVTVNKLKINKPEFLAECYRMNCPNINSDLIIPYWLDGRLDSLPISLLEKFVNYSIRKSRFYSEQYKDLMDECIPKSINHIDKHMKGRTEKGIFETFNPAKSILSNGKMNSPRRRPPFPNARYYNKRNRTIVCDEILYSKQQPLRIFLTSVVKYTENCLRRINNFGGILTIGDIDEDTKRAIDDFIDGHAGQVNSQSSKVRVQIDFSKISQLAAESEEVRVMLSNRELTDFNCESSQKIGCDLPQSEILSMSSQKRKAEILEFCFKLSPFQEKLITKIAENGWDVSKFLLQQEMPDSSIETLEASINSLALQLLGHLFILSERDNRFISPNFQDGVKLFLRQRGQTKKPTPGTVVVNDIPPSWNAFVGSCSEFHFQILKTIIVGQDVSNRIKVIADKNALMPESEIDKINEMAMATIGDLIIVAGSPPRIDEDTENIVEQILKIKETESESFPS